MNLKYNVEAQQPINQVLNEKFKISARLRNKLIKNKCVLLNGCAVDTRTLAYIGDIITVILDLLEDNSNIVPTKMNLDIVFEDEHLLAVNKPAGIAVHPSILHFADSLSNGVRYYFDQQGLHKKIRPINRIDLNTSGLVLFAKNEYVQECLIQQMLDNTFEKTYICLVSGHFQNKQGMINLPIARRDNSIIERCISDDGQTAITHYKVLNEFDTYSLVQCRLETGRTHQIRVHMAYIGHPLLGDTLYGINSNIIERQALHSYKMKFIHPVFNNEIMLEAEIPLDIKKLII